MHDGMPTVSDHPGVKIALNQYGLQTLTQALMINQQKLTNAICLSPMTRTVLTTSMQINMQNGINRKFKKMA